MRLIDADALREAHGMSANCESCPRKASWCGARTIYTLMDFCSWIDDAPTVDPPKSNKANRFYRLKVVDTKTGEVTTDSNDMEFVMDGLVSLLLGRYIHHYPSIKMVKYRNNYDGTITVIGYLTNGCRYEITKPEH